VEVVEKTEKNASRGRDRIDLLMPVYREIQSGPNKEREEIFSGRPIRIK